MNKKIKIKQQGMDKDFRETTLNEAFFEALYLSESRSSDIEKQEDDLHDYLIQYPEFINNITNEYKISVLKGWDYIIL